MTDYNKEDYERGLCTIDDSMMYECLYPLKRHYWNGWACPAFLTRDSFLKLTKIQCAQMQRDQDDDFLIEYMSQVKEVYIDGEQLFEIMGGLCWDEPERKGISAQDPRLLSSAAETLLKKYKVSWEGMYDASPEILEIDQIIGDPVFPDRDRGFTFDDDDEEFLTKLLDCKILETVTYTDLSGHVHFERVT